MEGPRDELKQKEEGKDGRKRDQHFKRVISESVQVLKEHILRVLHDGGRCYLVLDTLDVKDDPEREHGDDGPDARESDETEGIVLAVLIASDGGNTDAQRHNEGHGHRPRRHAARVKRHRPKFIRNEDTQDECRDIKDDEQHGEADAEHDAEHRDREEDAHSHRDRDNEQIVAELRHFLCNGGDLLCEDLQIGLRDRHDDADDEG